LKKLVFLICTLFSFLIVAELSSCFINDDDDGRLAAPERECEGTAIFISVPYINGVKYINIYREVSANADMSDSKVYNIGQIFPDKTKSSTPYRDVNTSASNYYRYYFRYAMGSYYQYTKESEKIQNTNATGEFDIGTTDVTLKYECVPEDRQFDLKIGTTVTLPDTGYDLYFIASNGTDTRPFKFAAADGDKEVKTDVTIDLQKYLTTDFLGVPIQIVSVIGSKKEEKADSDTVIYYWSNPRPVELHADDEDGNDEVVETITVPKTGSNTNDLDYRSNVIASEVIVPEELDY